MVDNFKEFCINAHGSQEYGKKPYVEHLKHVESILLDCQDIDGISDAELRCFAFGHDLIEDAGVKKEQISEMTSVRVAEAISLISDPQADNRKERKQQAYLNFKSCTFDNVKHLAATGKFADRLANMECCLEDYKARMDTRKLKMYLKEDEEFFQTYSNFCLSDSLLLKVKLIANKFSEIIKGCDS